MVKDTPYFSHDANARSDKKVISVRMKYKWCGYGLYFAVVEVLRCENNFRYPIADIDNLAFDFQTDPKVLKDIILNFGLFTKNKTHFWSESLLKRMELKELKSTQARLAAKKRWENERLQSESDADAMRPHSDSNASKLSEVKEVKKDKPLYTEKDPPYMLADALWQDIQNSGTTAKKPDMQKWSDEFDKIHRIDKRPWDFINKILAVVRADDFWQKNIKSPGTLRKQLNDGKLDRFLPEIGEVIPDERLKDGL